ncbi:unnamed protein product [Cochlearia groenlandica]
MTLWPIRRAVFSGFVPSWRGCGIHHPWSLLLMRAYVHRDNAGYKDEQCMRLKEEISALTDSGQPFCVPYGIVTSTLYYVDISYPLFEEELGINKPLSNKRLNICMVK